MTRNGATERRGAAVSSVEPSPWRRTAPPRSSVAGLALVSLAIVLLPGDRMAGEEVPSPSSRVSQRVPLSVESWGYQLQEFDLSALEKSAFDLLVIDYSTTGDASGELSAAQVEALRAGPCGQRAVLAYLSIGEAESYRYYFDAAWLDDGGDPGPGAPAFLGPTNPDWEGNYKVRYWLRAWQRILFGSAAGRDVSYLDRIIDAGFDGVYLDIVDAYEFWGPSEIGGNNERRRAPADMVKLIRRLASHARKTRGVSEFLVVPQNGAGIIHAETYPDAGNPENQAARQRRAYFRVIDGIGAEDTFYFGGRDQNNPLRPQRFTIALLDLFAVAGNTVLAIDYLTQRGKIDRFWRLASERGYIPYVSRRDLDRLTMPPGHAPVCG
ncbi:MAG TPA: MJ1477/TM1410 family putative glycoside hydrolase [Acidobacteriota bacterium]|nr:MJ1477/TM1410 family putative glycoside hydrolase [Acidobacteriota bacterium]